MVNATMRFAAVPLLTALALLVAACADGDGGPPPTEPVTRDSETAEIVLPVGDPSVAVQTVVQACREKDADRIRSFVDAAGVTTQDIEMMLARGNDVQLLSQTVAEAAEGVASVTVGLRIQREGGEETVERTWDLAQGPDGVWRLTELPDCF